MAMRTIDQATFSFLRDPRVQISQNIVDQIQGFRDLGRQTIKKEIDGIPYWFNEFWTARQRQSHSLHEISYRACFKPQLPEFFIARATLPGDAVCDPFMGRGTTPLQAALMGRKPIGNDINPLSKVLVQPRLRPPTLADVRARLATIDWSNGEAAPVELLAFYHPRTLIQINALRRWLRATEERTENDPVAQWIKMVAINRLSGHSPGFFSGRSMPPNQAVSVKAQERINARLGIQPPERDVPALIIKKSKSLLIDGLTPLHPPALLLTGYAETLKEVADGSVSLTVTSPPFLDVVQYAADNWLRCWFADIAVDEVPIAIHRTEQTWSAMVRSVLKEQSRVLRSGGLLAFEVGEVRKGQVLLERIVWDAAQDLPFDRLGVMINDQYFTKTANCWGVSNNYKGTNTNRIVLLKRR